MTTFKYILHTYNSKTKDSLILMDNLALIVVFSSFLFIWIIIVIFYTPACFNLKAMIDSIKKDGKLTKTKAPLFWYITNIYTIESWTITLPKEDKYLKYKEIEATSKKIKFYRKIMMYFLPIMILSIGILIVLLK